MAENRLNIISITPSSDQKHPKDSLRQRQQALAAKCERLWLQDPEQFNPLRNCMQRERLDRSWLLLCEYFNPEKRKVADIGCGAGVFSRRIRDAGAEIEAVDIAENALKHLRHYDMHHIQDKRDGMPQTTLPDQSYDAIICTEVIGYLAREDYRLFFSELSRLIKPDGYLLCSNAIDIYTEGGAAHLQTLAQTEFAILKAVRSYHALYIKLKHILEAPANFVKGGKNPQWRKEEIDKRSGFNGFWFRINSYGYISWLWKPFSWILNPVARFYKQSRKTLLFLEKICQFFWDESGVSHVILIGQRRPFEWTDKPSEPPVARLGKKEIWT